MARCYLLLGAGSRDSNWFSTQRDLTDAGVKHLFVRICLAHCVRTMFYIFFSYSDLSPVSVRSAVKLYLTSWFIQNLSNHASNKSTSVTSMTWFGRLFQTLVFVPVRITAVLMTSIRSHRIRVKVRVSVTVCISFCSGMCISHLYSTTFNDGNRCENQLAKVALVTMNFAKRLGNTRSGKS